MKAATYVTTLPCSLFFFFSITLHVLEWEQQPFVRKFELDHNNDRIEKTLSRANRSICCFFLSHHVFSFIYDHSFSLFAYSTRLSGAVRLTLNTSNWWDSTPPLLCSRSYHLLFSCFIDDDDNDDELKRLLGRGKLLFFSQYINGFIILTNQEQYIFMASITKI
jgi:hypothetical protein